MAAVRQSKAVWENLNITGTEYELYDLPGTYSLIPHSKEEEVVREFICYKDYDAIVAVCDAVCLERNLNLVLQVLSICQNVIVCVNLMDEARKKKIRINLEGISNKLKVPVIGITARNKEGFPKLLKTIQEMASEPNKRDTKNVNERICDENAKRLCKA